MNESERIIQEAARKAKEQAEKKLAEARQKAEEEKTARTSNAEVSFSNLLKRMKECESKGSNATQEEITNLLKAFDDLNFLDIYYERISIYEEVKSTAAKLSSIKNGHIQNLSKIANRKKVTKRLIVISIVLALCAGGAFGLYKYFTSESYKEQSRLKQIERDLKNKIDILEKQLHSQDQEKAKTEEQNEYKVGEWGEAGIVFYDKGNYSDGWRYLEACPGVTYNTYFSKTNGRIEGLSSAVGDGDINTKLIIEAFGEDTAAGDAANTTAYDKTDWYLGNVAEMTLCYNNLVNNNKNRKTVDKYEKEEKFYKLYSSYMEWRKPGTICYITSEQASADKCKVVIFSTNGMFIDGGHSVDIGNGWTSFKHKNLEGYKCWVRPIRKF